MNGRPPTRAGLVAIALATAFGANSQTIIRGPTIRLGCPNAGATVQVFGQVGVTQSVRVSEPSTTDAGGPMAPANFQWNVASCAWNPDAGGNVGAPVYGGTYEDVVVPNVLVPNDAGVPAATFCCNSVDGTAVVSITPIQTLR